MSCVIPSQKDRKEEPVYPKMDRTEKVQSLSGFIQFSRNIFTYKLAPVLSHRSAPLVNSHPAMPRTSLVGDDNIAADTPLMDAGGTGGWALGSHVWGFLGHGPRNHFNCTIRVGD